MHEVIGELLPPAGAFCDVTKDRLGGGIVVRKGLATDSDPHFKVRLDLLQEITIPRIRMCLLVSSVYLEYSRNLQRVQALYCSLVSLLPGS